MDNPKTEDVVSVAGSMATPQNKIKTSSDKNGIQRRKKMSDENLIAEGKAFKFYKENDLHIFEISDPTVSDRYHMGIKRNSSRYWRQDETLTEMMQHMNENRHRGFIVRTSIGDSAPIAKGF